MTAARERIIAAIGAAVAVIGLFVCLEITRTDEVQPAVTDMESVDCELVETVLLDLLDYGGSDSPLGTKATRSNEFLFEATPALYPQTAEEVLYEREPWKLTQAQRSASREAAAHLARRTEGYHSRGDFRVKDSRIRIYASESQNKGLGLFDRPISASPPGYSNDGRFAIVRLGIPWSIHHADGTFLLLQQNGKWTVILRQFVYYH